MSKTLQPVCIKHKKWRYIAITLDYADKCTVVNVLK